MVVTMATNFGTKIAINAYKCISTRYNDNAITYNRAFSWSANPKKTFSYVTNTHYHTTKRRLSCTCIALIVSRSSLRRSGRARVNKGLRSFTCHP